MIPIRQVLLTASFRRPFIQTSRRFAFPFPRFYSASLQPSEYHRVADETMDKLTAELETLLEENDLTGSDVEYSVRLTSLNYTDRIDWSVDSDVGKAWNLCD